MTLKEDKRPKTLLEYMGFKDEDINSQTHDEIVLLLSKKQNIEKILNQMHLLRNCKVDELVLEKALSDDYKQYGFVDIWFEYRNFQDHRGFGFIEVKTKPQSLGIIIREMEYYKSVTQRLYGRRFDRGMMNPILVSPTIIPDHIRQFDSCTLDRIKEIIS